MQPNVDAQQCAHTHTFTQAHTPLSEQKQTECYKILLAFNFMNTADASVHSSIIWLAYLLSVGLASRIYMIFFNDAARAHGAT